MESSKRYSRNCRLSYSAVLKQEIEFFLMKGALPSLTYKDLAQALIRYTTTCNTFLILIMSIMTEVITNDVTKATR
jgi:hypothetical protein